MILRPLIALSLIALWAGVFTAPVISALLPEALCDCGCDAPKGRCCCRRTACGEPQWQGADSCGGGCCGNPAPLLIRLKPCVPPAAPTPENRPIAALSDVPTAPRSGHSRLAETALFQRPPPLCR